MRKIENLIQSVRQESRVGHYCGIGAFLLVAIAGIATHFQGPTTTRSDSSPMMCLMLLGFIGLAYSRIMTRFAEIAEVALDDRGSGENRPSGAP